MHRDVLPRLLECTLAVARKEEGMQQVDRRVSCSCRYGDGHFRGDLTMRRSACMGEEVSAGSIHTVSYSAWQEERTSSVRFVAVPRRCIFHLQSVRVRVFHGRCRKVFRTPRDPRTSITFRPWTGGLCISPLRVGSSPACLVHPIAGAGRKHASTCCSTSCAMALLREKSDPDR